MELRAEDEPRPRVHERAASPAAGPARACARARWGRLDARLRPIHTGRYRGPRAAPRENLSPRASGSPTRPRVFAVQPQQARRTSDGEAAGSPRRAAVAGDTGAISLGAGENLSSKSYVDLLKLKV